MFFLFLVILYFFLFFCSYIFFSLALSLHRCARLRSGPWASSGWASTRMCTLRCFSTDYAALPKSTPSNSSSRWARLSPAWRPVASPPWPSASGVSARRAPRVARRCQVAGCMGRKHVRAHTNTRRTKKNGSIKGASFFFAWFYFFLHLCFLRSSCFVFLFFDAFSSFSYLFLLFFSSSYHRFGAIFSPFPRQAHACSGRWRTFWPSGRRTGRRLCGRVRAYGWFLCSRSDQPCKQNN
jgi:hypothetical protein